MEKTINYLPLLIVLAPFVGFALQVLAGANKSKSPLIGWISTLAVACSFGMALKCFLSIGGDVTAITSEGFNWITIGSEDNRLLDIAFDFSIDKLSGLMALFITFIATLIHLYSIGYMHDDETPWKFFAYLNLFTGMMLVLILGNSLPVMFLGWEGVGLCSYLLIGYWHKEMNNCKAAQKAFVANRVGDFFFLLGMFILYSMTEGKLDYASVNALADGISNGSVSPDKLMWGTLCLFLGACGKSAQIPLYVWLPDAMAGPTPVSALIHAATMVTSGLYLLARLSPVFSACPQVMNLVIVIGTLTALMAALIALTQTDIKKVLAYSTVSQLGYMFVAMGCGAFDVGIFHVFTHAFFKALLFLGSGAVILACHHEQDMRKMGGLWKSNKAIGITMLIGCIAIAGVPGFSGFFSKEEILGATLKTHHPYVYVTLLVTAVITAFYMFRMFFLTFGGTYRGHGHPHKVSQYMEVPLWILAVGAIAAGYAILPDHGSFVNVEHYLHDSVGHLGEHSHGPISHSMEMFLGIGAGFLGIFLAWKMFGFVTARNVPADGESFKNKWVNLSYQKFYVDEIYEHLILTPYVAFSGFCHTIGDRFIIEGIVNNSAKLIASIGAGLRHLQTGRIGHYALLMLLGVAAVLIWVFFKVDIFKGLK